MTKENAKQFLPFVQALAEGKVIQENSGDIAYPKWVDTLEPLFKFAPEWYRIKPEPRKFWIAVHANGTSQVFGTECEQSRYPTSVIIPVIEILP